MILHSLAFLFLSILGFFGFSASLLKLSTEIIQAQNHTMTESKSELQNSKFILTNNNLDDLEIKN